jgi:hypothetical protein
MRAFATIDFATAGVYDGAMNLTTIKIMSGASGNLKDVGIWATAIADETFKKIILTDPTSYVKKNMNSSCVLMLNQPGSYFIDASNVISTLTKKVNTTNGSNIITLASGYDNVGMVVGGKIINSDLTINTTITAINGRSVTLNAVMTVTRSSETVTVDSQIVTNSPLLNISKINFTVASTTPIKMMRNGSLTFSLYKSDKWDLAELSVTDLGQYGIGIDIPTGCVAEIVLKKTGNWGNINSSYGGI